MADKITVLFFDGTSITMDKPAAFDLQQYVHGMRSIGMVLALNMYVPASAIKAILIQNQETPDFIMGGPPSPTAPGTETKQ